MQETLEVSRNGLKKVKPCCIRHEVFQVFSSFCSCSALNLILVGSAGQPASPSSPVSPTHAGIAVCQLYD